MKLKYVNRNLKTFNKNTAIISIICIIISILIWIICYIPAGARHNSVQGNRVQDDADLLTDEEEAKLQSRIKDLSKRIGYDILIVTDDRDLSDEQVYSYTEHLGKETEVGWVRPGYNSLVLYLNMNIRMVDCYAYGNMYQRYYGRMFSDLLVEEVGGKASVGLYYHALNTGLSLIEYQSTPISGLIRVILSGPAVLLVLVYIIVACILCVNAINEQTKIIEGEEPNPKDYISNMSTLEFKSVLKTYDTYHSNSTGGGGSSGGGGGGGGGGGHSGGHF